MNVGVGLIVVLLLAYIARLGNDVVAAFFSVAAIVLGGAVLERLGSRPARGRGFTAADRAAVAVTLVLLLGWIAGTARPDDFGSPFPFSVAAFFLFLVWPRLRQNRSGFPR